MKKLYILFTVFAVCMLTPVILAAVPSHEFYDDFESVHYVTDDAAAGHSGWRGDLRNTVCEPQKNRSGRVMKLCGGTTYRTIHKYDGCTELSFTVYPSAAPSHAAVEMLSGTDVITRLDINVCKNECNISGNTLFLPQSDRGSYFVKLIKSTDGYDAVVYDSGGLFRKKLFMHSVKSSPSAAQFCGISFSGYDGEPLCIDNICAD